MVVSGQKEGPGLLKHGALQGDPYEAREVSGLIHNQSTRFQRRWQVRRRLQPFLNAASNLKSADFLPAERGSLQSFHARSLHPPTPLRLIIFPQCQIAQFDCSVCTSEEADEAGTYRDDPRRIDSGHNLDVDEPSLQHSTAKCTAKPKNDPNNKDKRRLQGFFHCRSPKSRSQDTRSSSARGP